MSLGLHENRQRRRRRFWWGVAKWVLALVLVLAAGVWSYRAGNQLAERKMVQAQEEIAALQLEVSGLQQQSAALATDLARAREEISNWKVRYEREVPTGFVREMMVLVKKKLEAGADEERLAFLVSAADKPRSCDEQPETKRFIVTTELQTGGANDAVSFGDRAITVTAVGQAARDGGGNLEAWYDPQKPVSVTFTQLGGKTVTAEGALPLHYSVVAGDDEFRFTALPGARGFLTVTADRCDYP
jgi:FtsZ-binding cell division protein ZapB